MSLVCPVCGQADAVRCKDDPRFYKDGRLIARCFHGNSHPHGSPVNFFVETGELIGRLELTPQSSLYQIAQAGPARGFGAAFLAEQCGIYVIESEDVSRSSSAIPTEAWMLGWKKQGIAVTVAPLFLQAELSGLEVRAMAEKANLRPGESAPKTADTRKTVGAAGVYISNTRLQPQAVVIFSGIWDAVSAVWDAFQNDSRDRYAFASIPDGFNPEHLKQTLETIFPGIPRLYVSDQDPSGQKNRKRFAKVATIAILPGAGLAKDYREADPSKRWPALLDGIERAMDDRPSQQQEENGNAKIARRAIQGTIRAKRRGQRDLEAWRYGQRCAGICKAPTGAKRYFSIRARIHGRTPIAEGLFEFDAILEHKAMGDIRNEYPSLAAVIEGGATESPLSPEWQPPVFLENGQHWTSIPVDLRKSYASERGWEPWQGRDIGVYEREDLVEVLDRIGNAYHYCIIPGAPAVETGLRVAVVSFATAMCALRAQELAHKSESPGFSPATWFYGGPATGKGTAAKIVCAGISGEIRTYGSQRFGGERENGWLTESALHLPAIFKDELDQYLDRSASEDLKAFLGGEALQRRKAYGVDMTLYSRPVVFSTNSLRINPEDDPLKERVILVELQPNPLASKNQRNNAFNSFHEWLIEDGRTSIHRVVVHLYSLFRQTQLSGTRWTRSAAFDAALELVCKQLDLDPSAIMAPSVQNKEAAILKGAAWYQAIEDYIQCDLDGVQEFTIRASALWEIRLEDESQKRKLRRYLESFHAAAKEHGGSLIVMGYIVEIPPFKSSASSTSIRFRRLGYAEAS